MLLTQIYYGIISIITLQNYKIQTLTNVLCEHTLKRELPSIWRQIIYKTITNTFRVYLPPMVCYDIYYIQLRLQTRSKRGSVLGELLFSSPKDLCLGIPNYTMIRLLAIHTDPKELIDSIIPDLNHSRYSSVW